MLTSHATWQNQLRWSSIKEIIPPFPVVKNPNNFLVTFDVKLTTQILSKVRKSKKFEKIHNLIVNLHKERIGQYRDIKNPTGINYTPKLIGMFFYKFRKTNNRLKHSELKLSNIRFFC